MADDPRTALDQAHTALDQLDQSLKHAYHHGGESLSSLASVLDLTTEATRARLRGLGVPLRGRGRAPDTPPPAPELTATSTEWRADWLNAWIATLGIARLIPHARIAWDPRLPAGAIVHHPAATPLVDTITQALPTADDIPTWCDPITQTGNRLVPGVPKGWLLQERMARLIDTLDGLGRAEAVEQSLHNPPLRVPGNGVGFDYRRIIPRSWGDGDGGPMIDPVVELLIIAGLPMLHPVAGGWRGWGPDKLFRWFAWTEPRDWWGIDQLLHTGGHAADVTMRYRSVAYRAPGKLDPTRGYNSTEDL